MFETGSGRVSEQLPKVELGNKQSPEWDGANGPRD